MMIKKSQKLAKVSYDIRGPIYQKAQEFTKQGIDILQLNIGNPAPYGFEVPAHLMGAVKENMGAAQGYVSSNGIEEAKEAIFKYATQKGIACKGTEHVYIGNGVSELIGISLQALLNVGDEVLLPSPDYPLWTSTVTLCGGNPVHYRCDEASGWLPDLQDIQSKITARTKALVLINPNNPTGAVYPKSFLERLVALARENKLMLLSDEIYDKVLFDGEEHHATASIAQGIPCITYGGLSKNYMATGFRAGWMIVSGHRQIEQSFFDGLDILMSMRLCSNALAQFAIKPALEEKQYIEEMVSPGGRLFEQRNYAHRRLNAMEGISCVMPKGAMYMFPKIDVELYNIQSDADFVLEFLAEEKVLLVQGSGFNWKSPDHFRITFLPDIPMLEEAMNRLERFLEKQMVKKPLTYAVS